MARLARRQKGLVTTAQLQAAGLGHAAIGRRVEAERYVRLYTGVYFVGAGPVPVRSQWLAGVLAAGSRAVLSHESAAGLWGIGPEVVLPVHVTVPAPVHRRSRRGLRVHTSALLTAAEVAMRDGIPVTSPLRTLADLPAHAYDRAANAALVARLVTTLPGRARTRSGAERRFLRLLRAHGLPLPAVNVAVEGMECDFAWTDGRLVVELDGPHHDQAPQRASDRRRDALLQLAGWTVLRFGSDEIADAPARVAATVRAALSRRP